MSQTVNEKKEEENEDHEGEEYDARKQQQQQQPSLDRQLSVTLIGRIKGKPMSLSERAPAKSRALD